jgi:hypothetical protein
MHIFLSVATQITQQPTGFTTCVYTEPCIVGVPHTSSMLQLITAHPLLVQRQPLFQVMIFRQADKTLWG